MCVCVCVCVCVCESECVKCNTLNFPHFKCHPNNVCWKCQKGPFIHCLWDCPLIQPLWHQTFNILIKQLGTTIPLSSRLSLLGDREQMPSITKREFVVRECVFECECVCVCVCECVDEVIPAYYQRMRVTLLLHRPQIPVTEQDTTSNTCTSAHTHTHVHIHRHTHTHSCTHAHSSMRRGCWEIQRGAMIGLN